MKNIILLFVILFSVSNLKAFECGECQTPWENTLVVGEFRGNFGNCTFLIDISYRECPGPPNRKEVRINNISLPASCAITLDKPTIMSMAMKIVLNSSHSIFPSLPSTTQEIFLYTDCCWHFTDSGFYKEFIPCLSTCCCESRVTVDQATRADGSKFFKLSSKIKLSGGSQSTCTTIDGTCTYICDAIDSIDVGENLADVPFSCPDTCSQEWSTPDNYALGGASSCTAKSVQYFTRVCNGKVQIKFGSFSYNPSSPNTCMIDELLINAIEQTIRNEAKNYTLPKTFEVLLPTCYELTTWPNNVEVVQVCYWEDNCCKASYYIGGSDPYYSSSFVFDTLNGFVSCGLRTECEFICDEDHLKIHSTFKMANLELKNNTFDSKVNIHPNPTNGKLQFDIYTDFTKDLTIEIYDNLGKMLFKQGLKNINNQITFIFDTDGLQNGIYLYKIKSGLAEINTGKFIKQ